MTAEELARKFEHYRRDGRGFRARCPVHKSKGLTLAIYADPERSSVHCHAGCQSDDVLKAVGLTWKDTYYQPLTKLDRKQQESARRQREASERKSSQLRVGTWILRFIANGYTREDRDYDVSALLACALVLSNNGGTRIWETIFRQHMERVEAANYCMLHGMLPEVAKERTLA